MLPSGHLFCFTVQGEHGFAFNLISNDLVDMNAKFVPDARREEVTWLGSMGIIVKGMKYGDKSINNTKLRFEVDEKIFIGDKIVLEPRNIDKLTFKNGKLLISEVPPLEGFRYPSVFVDLTDVGLSFTIKFLKDHLDLFWHTTAVQLSNSHGIIGMRVCVCVCVCVYGSV